MNEIEIRDFRYNEHLKALLVLYVSRQYEECAMYDDWHLMQEYYHLKRNNKLHLLFEEEHFTGYMNDENNYRHHRGFTSKN